MSILNEIGSWLTTSANWHGARGIPAQLGTHMQYTAESVAIACVIAIPIGMWLGHIGRGGLIAINLSNIGRAIPTYALLVLLFVGLGAFHRTIETIISLVAFALPPLLTNSYIGVLEVDPRAKEAARGMGMSGWQLLRRVELPLALPLILDGLRIAVVQVVATTTVAALIGVGGLGRFVVDGFTNQDPGQYGGGAVLVAVLALLLEGIFWLLARIVDPTRRADRRAHKSMSAKLSEASETVVPAR